MTKQLKSYDFLEPPAHEGDLGMLGSYRILGEMGRGGMGYVFRAEDTVLERPVALKVMNKKIASTPNSRDRFLQEARAMAAVHHDNVVVIFEVGTHEGTPFMAMELLRGETLEAVNAGKEPVDYERVIDYARQISRGLAAAHAKGIVHRDIKPANIWVEEGSGRIKILDFGLALAQSPAGDSTGVGSVCGTPGYLTPEQARSDPLDDRSDLYSLGVVLYEMCTGKLPTAQPAIAEQLVALLTRSPTPVRELNPDIPQPLADLIQLLLSKEPGDRPANALELDKQLQKVARECEAKSEVALSLGKLQESLKEVVSKQVEVEPEPVEIMQVPDFDPLSVPALPAPLPPNVPGARTPAAVGQRRMNPPGKQPQTSPAHASVSPVVWMGAGVLATLLLVLGIFWMVIPDQGENYVVTAPGQSNPVNPSTTPKQGNPANANQQSRASNNTSNKTPNRNKNNANQQSPKSNQNKGNQQNSGKSNASNASANKNSPSSGPGNEAESVASRSDVASEADSETDGKSSRDIALSESAAGDSGGDVMPSVDDSEVNPADAIEPTPTVTVSKLITNLTGFGADTTTHRNDTKGNAQGTKDLLIVQTRNDQDLKHIYVRFDLRSPEFKRADVQNVTLSLAFLIGQKINKTKLNVYGWEDPDAEAWKEDEKRGTPLLWKNSVSLSGLESLPLLATWDSDAVDEGDLRRKQEFADFASDKLTQFILDSWGRTVSFVIAGGAERGIPIRFLSKERDPEFAPSLKFEVAQ
ncbi:serine/threonine protein kinase [Rhodopirellula rubra]|uniref:Serine/threonine protein kinase n=1 Tax=Aporhodopirellula rubra TaxID=980271 RepID=A0A7W5DWC3_9BACT|nr:serine/threonine-protein kinase [Aporhodopirellula rubra]MBB3205288.1 serine/threonine protein kinase [Aporhodopirellula rubra]